MGEEGRRESRKEEGSEGGERREQRVRKRRGMGQKVWAEMDGRGEG